jgi:hypothetical protein
LTRPRCNLCDLLSEAERYLAERPQIFRFVEKEFIPAGCARRAVRDAEDQARLKMAEELVEVQKQRAELEAKRAEAEAARANVEQKARVKAQEAALRISEQRAHLDMRQPRLV